jgi:hypothetical protein
VVGNVAQGGQGTPGGNGGNGFGGGFYNDGTSMLTLQHELVTANLALGGNAGAGGTNGEGIGGGVYNLGAFSFDVFTIILGNHASTSNDNIGP